MSSSSLHLPLPMRSAHPTNTDIKLQKPSPIQVQYCADTKSHGRQLTAATMHIQTTTSCHKFPTCTFRRHTTTSMFRRRVITSTFCRHITTSMFRLTNPQRACFAVMSPPQRFVATSSTSTFHRHVTMSLPYTRNA